MKYKCENCEDGEALKHCTECGLATVPSMPDTKTTKEEKCNAEKNGVKCRPPCKTCYGGAIITPSTIEERFKERFAERLSEIHGRTYLRLGIQLWDAEELFAFLTEERRLAQEESKKDIDELVEALIWCSGSSDFSPGGIAEEGWKKVKPLIDKHLKSGLSLTNLSNN